MYEYRGLIELRRQQKLKGLFSDIASFRGKRDTALAKKCFNPFATPKKSTI